MSYQFSEISKHRLSTAHTDLQALFNTVIKYRDCSVLCGYRSRHDQNQLYQQGKSHAMYPQSKHNHYPSLAVDVVPFPVDWKDINRFYHFAGFVFGIAAQMGIRMKWGGDFNGFFDGPHFELID